MKNFFSFLNSRRQTAGQVGPTVSEVLSVASHSPKAGINLAQKGVTFSSFDDWLRMATKGAIASPYAFSWRKLALQYPPAMTISDLSMVLDSIKKKPLLADQAQAIIFSVSSEKLPNVSVLEDLVIESDEQLRIKQLLIRKKILGNEKFISESLANVVFQHSEGKVKFSLEGGREFILDSNSLTITKKKRFSTIFGEATLVCVREKHYEEIGVVRHFFFLVDGDAYVCRMREIEFYKIIRTEKEARTVLAIKLA
jgi:hypothetical protein